MEKVEEDLTNERQNNHRLKVSNTQLTEKCNQMEGELNRLKTVEQSHRDLSVKYGDIQNTTEHSKAVNEAEKTRL